VGASRRIEDGLDLDDFNAARLHDLYKFDRSFDVGDQAVDLLNGTNAGDAASVELAEIGDQRGCFGRLYHHSVELCLQYVWGVGPLSKSKRAVGDPHTLVRLFLPLFDCYKFHLIYLLMKDKNTNSDAIRPVPLPFRKAIRSISQ
jgi:hypothetical protein